MHGGFVAHGEFVEAGGHGPVAFEAVDAALHGVTLLVPLRIEGRVAGPFLRRFASWSAFERDRRDDPAPAQVAAVGLRRVRLVSEHPVRAGPGPAAAEAWHPNPVEHRNELRAVPALPGGQHDRQRLLPLLTCKVHFRGQAAPRATEPVIVRFDRNPARWFGLQIRLPRAPAACRCARATVESTDTSQTTRPARSARAYKGGQDSRPGPITLPAATCRAACRMPSTITW